MSFFKLLLRIFDVVPKPRACNTIHQSSEKMKRFWNFILKFYFTRCDLPSTNVKAKYLS